MHRDDSRADNTAELDTNVLATNDRPTND